MPYESYVPKKFQAGSMAIIEMANVIIEEYRRQGFTLTLRQLYYQFVARDIVPNRQSEYKRLGSIINDGRLAGLIDWEAIEDRTRNVRTSPAWDGPEQIMRAVADQFCLDLWEGQKYRPEVWIEKDALVGVIEPACRKFRVPFFACRGYSSQSEQWRAGSRFASMLQRGLIPIVFHLGDHDPSGIDMTRDNADRLAMFAGEHIEVRRLALNFDQVEQYKPPPNPAKDSDSRVDNYRALYGDSSWELDALEPTTIDDLISDEIDNLIDSDAWDHMVAKEEQHRENLTVAADRWSDVEKFLEG